MTAFPPSKRWLPFLPVAIGSAAAILLFVLLCYRQLNGWSANTDHPHMGYDYFGLPRAAIALRGGTNPFTSHTQYPYGPYATEWISWPTLAIFGVPLSYLSPWVGFWTFNTFHLLLHLGMIRIFGRRMMTDRSPPPIVRTSIFMLAMGFFMPWYVMYYMAQYHSLAVLAVFLVLAGRGWISQVAGFGLSAIGKPLLAPAAVVLLVRREWRVVAGVLVVLLVGVAQWFVLRYDVPNGLRWEMNPLIPDYLQRAGQMTKLSVHRWNQQVCLAAALDEWMPTDRHLPYRYALACLMTAGAGLLAWRRDRNTAICLSLLWFFTLYARGFEYHYTLFIPIMLYLWSRSDGAYRTWWMVFLGVAMALPTAWVIFKYAYHFPDPGFGSPTKMLETNKALFYLFLWQKPALVLLLGATIAWTERPQILRRSTPVPEPAAT